MIVSFWGSLDLFKGGTENFQGVVMTILAPTFGPFSVLSKAQLRLFRRGTVLRPDSKSFGKGLNQRWNTVVHLFVGMEYQWKKYHESYNMIESSGCLF